MASVVNPDFKFPSPTQEEIFILHYQGNNVEVRLWWELVSKPQETPIKISWKFLTMTPKNIEGINENRLKAIICEALQVYKKLGIRSEKTKNTEVLCIGFEGGE